MEGKKISFGFMKTKKVEKPLTDNNEDRKDYIECVEEQSIKVLGGETQSIIEPLVIPMKPNTLMKSNRLMEIAEEVESALNEPTIKMETVDENTADPLAENETLDQMAVRELLQEVKKETVTENPSISIPTTAVKGVTEGEKESTLDDYESVPIQDFGVAMLRGMGWAPGQSGSKYKQPELRPKGLGLGADKVVKPKPQSSKDGKQEELILMKNAFVKITLGKYSDYYGKVVSLDEDNGRVMVDITLKKETVSLSEFMMHVVTKSEYDKESKVIRKLKRPPLSVDKKKEIFELYEKKCPVSDIARQLKVSRKTVYRWINRSQRESVLTNHVLDEQQITHYNEVLPIVVDSDVNLNLAEKQLTNTMEEEQEIKTKGQIESDNEFADIISDEESFEELNEKEISDEDSFKELNENEISGKDSFEDLNEKEMSDKGSFEEINEKDSFAELNEKETSDKNSFQELNEKEASDKDSLEELNIDEVTCKKMTLEYKKKRIISMHEQKCTVSEIAKCLDIANQAVRLCIQTWKQKQSDIERSKRSIVQKRSSRPITAKPTLKCIPSEKENSKSNSDTDNTTTSRSSLEQNITSKTKATIDRPTRKTLTSKTKATIDRPRRKASNPKLKSNATIVKPKQLISEMQKEKIIEMYKQNESIGAIARRLKIASSTTFRCIERWKKDGSLVKLPGGRPRKLPTNEDACMVTQMTKESELLPLVKLTKTHEISKSKKKVKKYARQDVCDDESSDTEIETNNYHLSDAKKVKIHTLFEKKYSISAIARHLDIERNTVSFWIKRWHGEGTIQLHTSSGRQRKLTADDKSSLIEEVTKDDENSALVELAKSRGVCAATKRRVLLRHCIKEKKKRKLKDIDTDESTDNDEDTNNYRISDAKKVKIIALFNKNHSITAIARHMDISQKSVSLWIKRWQGGGNIQPRVSSGRPPKLTANDDTTLIEEITKNSEKLTLDEMAKSHGVSKSTIGRFLKSHGIRKKYIPKRKDIVCNDDDETSYSDSEEETNHHMSVAKKIKILKLFEEKHSMNAIARYLNIARNTVRLWVKRWQTEGTIQLHTSSGRPRKLTAIDETSLIEEVTNEKSTVVELAKSRGISAGTMRRVLLRHGIRRRYKRRIKDIESDESIDNEEEDPNNYHISDAKKAKIIALFKKKHSMSAIARHLGIAQKTVSLWIKRWQGGGNIQPRVSSGRPPKLTANDDTTLIEEITKNSEKLTLDEMAKSHGVSKSTIVRFLKSHGIRKKYKPKRKDIVCNDDDETSYSDSEEETNCRMSVAKKMKILKLFEEKHSISAIARHLNISCKTVSLWVKRWQMEGTIQFHSSPGRPRKLSLDTETILKEQRLVGGDLKKVAAKHGVSVSTIHADSFEEYKRNESLKISSNQDNKSSGQDKTERDRKDQKENYRRDERDRRGDKDTLRRNEREAERRHEKEQESSRSDKERERRDDRDRMDDRDRRDERDRKDGKDTEKRNEREGERRHEKEQESSRSDKERDRRDVREQHRHENEREDVRERNKNRDKIIKDKDRESDSDDSRKYKDQDSSNGRRKQKYTSESSNSEDERAIQKKKHKKRSGSSDSLSSLSDYDKKKHKRSKHKSKKNKTPEVKRDIDKKRKGKKKRRDRDRSPNYKKHRK